LCSLGKSTKLAKICRLGFNRPFPAISGRFSTGSRGENLVTGCTDISGGYGPHGVITGGSPLAG
jgi:hypothetical protein